MAGILSVKQVSKTYGSVKALDQVSIEVEKGTIHGLIGENGAGKTTLIKALVGIHTLDEGELLFREQPIYENNENKRLIGYVADQNQYFNNYKLKQLVSFYKEIYPLFSEEKFNQYNRVMGLNLNKRVRQLSKGMKMRLSIMLNLAMNPEMLILDEPTSGLDVVAKKKVLEWLVEEVETRQMTVVIASHHLSELERLCDSITIIDQGKVTYQASVDELKDNVCKLQVAFEKEAPQDLMQWEGVQQVETIGSVHYIVVMQHTQALMQRLQKHGVKLMERIPLSLEEAFVCMNEKGENNETIN